MYGRGCPQSPRAALQTPVSLLFSGPRVPHPWSHTLRDDNDEDDDGCNDEDDEDDEADADADDDDPLPSPALHSLTLLEATAGGRWHAEHAFSTSTSAHTWPFLQVRWIRAAWRQ